MHKLAIEILESKIKQNNLNILSITTNNQRINELTSENKEINNSIKALMKLDNKQAKRDLVSSNENNLDY